MPDRLLATAARLVGCPPSALQIELRPPLEHQSNRLYDAWADGRHLIVKEYLKPEDLATGPLHEHRALELLAPLDVAPRPVGIAQAHGPEHGPLVVYEYLDGEMWDRRRPSANELEALAEVWLTVQAIPQEQVSGWFTDARPVEVAYASFGESFRQYAAWSNSADATRRRPIDLCLDVLARRRPVVEELSGLEQRDPRRAFCRSDARFANVIQRPNGTVGLVDWEDSGLRDPAREVMDLLSHPNQEDLLAPDEWQAFLAPYLAVQAALDPALPRRIHLYAALFPLFWLALFFRLGIDRAQAGTLAGWTINGLPANARLRRYLARALTWPDPDIARQLDGLGDLSFFPEATLAS
jgi:aminoglycoside phosphotransferase (APT) family kinase protein